VRWSHWLQRIFEPNLAQSTNTTLSTRRNSQINITWKSNVAVAAILNMGKMSITMDWIKVSAPNLMRRCITTMRRWHITRSRNRKLIHVTSLKELQELSTYKSLFLAYAELIWSRYCLGHLSYLSYEQTLLKQQILYRKTAHRLSKVVYAKALKQ